MIIDADRVKTHIPEIDIEFEVASFDDAENEYSHFRELERQYNTKEDADVAVFLKIVERMPLKSLLHLLQGHVRSQHQDQYTITATEKSPEKRKKEFRWAESSDKTVIKEVNEVDALKGVKELWFGDSELMDIRRDLVRQIRFFMRHHKERLESLEIIVAGEDPEYTLEQHMKALTKHSIARGLEGHMSKLIPQNRKKHVSEILNAQTACKSNGQSYDESIEILRKHALENGQTLKMFAQRMAKCDEIEALTANMSHWEGEENVEPMDTL